MKTFKIWAIMAVLSLSTVTATAAPIPRETLPINATEEQAQIVENLIADILDDVQADKLGFTLAAGYANTGIRQAVTSNQNDGNCYGVLLPIAQNAIRFLSSLLLKPALYM